MRRGLVYLLYNALLPFVLLILLPASVRKMRKRGGYGGQFWQRFGSFAAPVRARLAAPQDFWIHAVSVGEVLVARKLVAALGRARPGLAITLSTTTSTGHAVATEGVPENVTVIYNPIDLPWVVSRVFALVRPRHLVLVEAEVWPNLVARARRDGVPVTLVNARMSDRSARRYQRFRRLVGPIFGQLDRILVQEAEDGARWRALGLPPGKVLAIGSLKFDQADVPAARGVEAFRELLDALWPGVPRRLLLAASTHPGEESLIAESIRALRGDFPDLRLAIVPRHAERGEEVACELAAAGFGVVRRSLLGERVDPVAGDVVFLIDSTGELGAWTALADLVVIGKSLCAGGGQNPAEALALGKPVVVGPHMQNFRALTERLTARGAVVQLTSPEDLEHALRGLLADPVAARAMAGRAAAIFESHHGANRRAAAHLLERRKNEISTCVGGRDLA
ncbi:3-deoxy-D-manno-octulosonic acid transferase [soil metagenome]